MIQAAKIHDKLVRYLSLGHGDEPIGEVNLGLVSETQLDTQWQDILRKCHQTLKESLNQGSNQLRIYELNSLDPIPEEPANLDLAMNNGES